MIHLRFEARWCSARLCSSFFSFFFFSRQRRKWYRKVEWRNKWGEDGSSEYLMKKSIQSRAGSSSAPHFDVEDGKSFPGKKRKLHLIWFWFLEWQRHVLIAWAFSDAQRVRIWQFFLLIWLALIYHGCIGMTFHPEGEWKANHESRDLMKENFKLASPFENSTLEAGFDFPSSCFALHHRDGAASIFT